MATASASSNGSREKFQALLRELFQFDSAELDFGIYRIMNHKRDVVERFITEKLPNAIDGALEIGQLAEQEQAKADLRKACDALVSTLGADALDADGNLIKFEGTPVGKAYRTAKEAAEGARGSDAVEVSIYNHLYTFFSRYYQEGDFISKRRYSRNQKYAIPYNGEEVYLHWANSDQYYVKTDEHFKNYDWIAPNGVAVHFRVQSANVEQNNVNGDKRFFLPIVEGVSWNSDARSIDIPFKYRPLTDSEKRSYGTRNQQDKIISAAVSDIPESIGSDYPDALSALIDEHRRNAKGESVSRLEHHLLRYTRRNEADFFIHKDLKGFLNRELDFYLKNEVLKIEEIVSTGETAAEGWFQQMSLMKNVGGEIIDFLAQIEDFQKMLWEKKKFVVDTQYCVALGNVSADFHADIAVNDAQWDEWHALIGIDEDDRCAEFLQSHPTLMLDTRHFCADFTDRLLASFDDLDSMTDGLLIHSENWQALQLAQEKFRGQVKCVHIDPPYNPQSEAFLYKSGYPDSTWLAMLRDRIAAGHSWMSKDGYLLCHIDDIEYEKLHLTLEGLQIPSVGTMIWDKRNPMTGGGGIAMQHEYVICRSESSNPLIFKKDNLPIILDKAREIQSRYGVFSEDAKSEFSRWVSRSKNFTGGERAYRFLDNEGKVYSSVSLRAPERRSDPKFFEPLIHPLTGKPCPVPPNGFSRTPETLNAMVERGEILFGNDENTQPRQKRFLVEGTHRQLTSVIQDATKGKSSLDALGLDDFPYSHSVSFYETLLGATLTDPYDISLDYFAGSGTTAHAVINLNREDGGERKFVLVEMGDYFNTVLLPRIKKVTFAPEWKRGKPERPATPEEAERSPRIVKYMRMESYEDALDCIEFDANTVQMPLEERIEDYPMKYMLKWETRDSATLLNVSELALPFSYKLRSHANGETREQNADVAETFNYLLGLTVRTRRVYHDDGRRYLVYRGETREAPGRVAVVVWRETEGWTEDDYERDRKFVIERNLMNGADITYINGASCIPGTTELEPLFSARMFAPLMS